MSDPNRFSILSNRMPQSRAPEAGGVPEADKAVRSAFYQIAQDLLYAGVFADVIFLGNRASLVPEF